ncbi:hypothetical protein BBJ28_00013261 [Nothophytophthora sp. Chile5]|nr:hypothetical protein BBJ28_00013261 [Nothophytophthora sp. Chile5]
MSTPMSMTDLPTSSRQHPAYTAGVQVDALAACSLASSIMSDDAEDDEDEPELPLLAVALSQLEGNVWSGGVALLDGATSERLCELQMEAGVGALAWCGVDGDVLALACDDGDVRLARLSTDVAFAFVPLSTGGGSSVIEGDATRDSTVSAGDEAAVVGWGHDDVVTGVSAVKLWDIATMDKTVATLEGHSDLIWAVAMNPTHAHLLCSASQDATVQVWDARRPQSAALAVSTLLPALAVDWHPKQPTVFSVGLEDGTVCTFDIRSPHTPLARRETHGAAVHVVKYSPFHDDLLASGGDDGKAFVTTDSFSSSRVVASATRELLVGDKRTAPHRDYVRALDWFQLATTTPLTTGKNLDTLLATGSWDKNVHTWNMDDYTAPAEDESSSLAASGATAPSIPAA